MLYDLTKLEKFSRTDRFREAAIRKETTGVYCPFPAGTEEWNIWWDQEDILCRDGLEIDGVRITGPHYFFLNYCPLSIAPQGNSKGKKGVQVKPWGLPRFWGIHYDFFHAYEQAEMLGKDMCVVKPRRAGFSQVAAALGTHNYTFMEKSKSLYIAYAANYLDDVLGKSWDYLNWLNADTEGGMSQLREVKNTEYHKRASAYTEKGVELGSMASIEGVVCNHPRKIRGKFANRAFIEEAGSFPNLIPTLTALQPVVKEGDLKVGTILMYGTGGEDGPGIEGFKEVFYNPEQWDMLEFSPDGVEGEMNKTCYFFPHHYTRRECMDVDGNIDYELAEKHIQIDRDNWRKGSGAVYVKKCAENPITAGEALISLSGNTFDLEKVASQILDIETGRRPPEEFKPKLGRLEWVRNSKGEIQEVEFIEDSIHGKIWIVEKPERGENGERYSNLYISGIDSIDIGKNETSEGTKDSQASRLSMTVKKRQHNIQSAGNMYVCFYKDRPHDIYTAYENCLKICMYYDCQINLEFTKTNIISYFRKWGKYNKFIKRPAFALSDKSGRSSTKLIGTQATSETNAYMDRKLEEYISKYCDRIFFLEILKELKDYNSNHRTKFDTVVSMGLCEVADEDMMNKLPKLEVENSEDVGYMVGWHRDEYGRWKRGKMPIDGSSPGDNTPKTTENIKWTTFEDLNEGINFYT